MFYHLSLNSTWCEMHSNLGLKYHLHNFLLLVRFNSTIAVSVTITNMTAIVRTKTNLNANIPNTNATMNDAPSIVADILKYTFTY